MPLTISFIVSKLFLWVIMLLIAITLILSAGAASLAFFKWLLKQRSNWSRSALIKNGVSGAWYYILTLSICLKMVTAWVNTSNMFNCSRRVSGIFAKAENSEAIFDKLSICSTNDLLKRSNF